MNTTTFNTILAGWVTLGVLIFLVLLYVPAPYGRHSRRGWGPRIPNKVGWVLMELPSLLTFVYFFLQGEPVKSPVTWIFFSIWVFHYTNRSLVYPFRTRTRGKQMPLVIALFAIFFNVVNGSLNGLWFSLNLREYTFDWLYDARFIAGTVIFVTGAVINFRSDRALLHLRNSDGNGYKIPEGRLFRYVSCPNFSGEILEWTGFAIMIWSPAGLAFALWTFFNLVPRALEHHKWYKKEFADYPTRRKAVIPFLL